MSTKKIVLIVSGVVVGIVVLVLVGIILFGVLAAIMIPSLAKEAKYKGAMQVATSFRTSAENSCLSYMDMGKEAPTKFSQFLSVANNPDQSMDTILNMDYLGDNVVSPNKQSEIDSNTFDMELDTGTIVTYTLGANCSVDMVEKK